MEDFSVSELILGMRDGSLKQQRLTLVQLLINRVADTDRALTQQESEALFVLVLTHIGNHSQLTHPVLDLLLRLVSNLTITEAYAQQFMDLIASSDTYRHGFQSSVEQFLSYNPQVEIESDKALVGGGDDEWIDADPWQYMSSTLCNMCQVEGGRSFMLRRTTDSSFIERILKQVSIHPSIHPSAAGDEASISLFSFDLGTQCGGEEPSDA